MGKNTGRRDAKRRSLVKKEGRRDVNASRKYKERFLLSSTVVIRAECIVDIDLPCRTEPACSFPQHSFIILAGQDSHLLHTSPSLLLSLSLSEIINWNRSFAWTNPLSKLVAGIRQYDVAACSQPAKWWWCSSSKLCSSDIGTCYCEPRSSLDIIKTPPSAFYRRQMWPQTSRSANKQLNGLIWKQCRLQAAVNPDCLLNHWKISTGSCSKMMNAK